VTQKLGLFLKELGKRNFDVRLNKTFLGVAKECTALYRKRYRKFLLKTTSEIST